jgi:hypothetical protein
VVDDQHICSGTHQQNSCCPTVAKYRHPAPPPVTMMPSSGDAVVNSCTAWPLI